MHVRNHFLLPVVALVASAGLLLAPNAAWAYVGPGPGMEMIPFFQSLVVWIGLGMGAALLWPLRTLLSRLRRGRQPQEAAAAGS